MQKDRKHKLTSGVSGLSDRLSLFGFSVVFPGAVGHCGMSSFFLSFFLSIRLLLLMLVFFWVPPGIWVELDCLM